MRGLLGTKTKIIGDSESSSYRMGGSIGIALKRLLKRIRYSQSLTVGSTEFNLSSIRIIESQL